MAHHLSLSFCLPTSPAGPIAMHWPRIHATSSSFDKRHVRSLVASRGLSLLLHYALSEPCIWKAGNVSSQRDDFSYPIAILWLH